MEQSIDKKETGTINLVLLTFSDPQDPMTSLLCVETGVQSTKQSHPSVILAADGCCQRWILLFFHCLKVTEQRKSLCCVLQKELISISLRVSDDFIIVLLIFLLHDFAAKCISHTRIWKYSRVFKPQQKTDSSPFYHRFFVLPWCSILLNTGNRSVNHLDFSVLSAG